MTFSAPIYDRYIIFFVKVTLANWHLFGDDLFVSHYTFFIFYSLSYYNQSSFPSYSQTTNDRRCKKKQLNFKKSCKSCLFCAEIYMCSSFSTDLLINVDFLRAMDHYSLIIIGIYNFHRQFKYFFFEDTTNQIEGKALFKINIIYQYFGRLICLCLKPIVGQFLLPVADKEDRFLGT